MKRSGKCRGGKLPPEKNGEGLRPGGRAYSYGFLKNLSKTSRECEDSATKDIKLVRGNMWL